MKKEEKVQTIAPWLSWTLKNRTQLFWGAICLIALLVLVGKVGSYFGKKEEVFTAQKLYQDWEKSLDIKDRTLLEKKIDSEIAQFGYLQGKMVQNALAENQLLEKSGKKALARMEKELPFHSQFAKTSFLIANLEHEKALTQAEKLKAELQGEKERFPLLYGENLLRIALLKKELKKVDGKDSFKEVASYLSENREFKKGMEKSFSSERGVSFDQYLDRELRNEPAY